MVMVHGNFTGSMVTRGGSIRKSAINPLALINLLTMLYYIASTPFPPVKIP